MLVNAVYIVKQRVDMIGRPTGIDVENIFVVSATGFGRNLDHAAMVRRGPRLAAEPARRHRRDDDATPVPLSGGGSSDYVKRTPDAKIGRQSLVNYFEVTERGADTLGLKLLAGRWFTRERSGSRRRRSCSALYSGPIVVNREYAERIFPNESRARQDAVRVARRAAHHHRRRGSHARLVAGAGDGYVRSDVMYIPRIAIRPERAYIVRAKPGMRDALMRKVEKELGPRNAPRAIDFVRPLDLYEKRSVHARPEHGDLPRHRHVAAAGDHVARHLRARDVQREHAHQAGRHAARGGRAAAGRRRCTSSSENWMITTGGVVVGSILALAAGHLLSLEYELPRVDLYYIVGGVLVLWVVGLAAAWHPARRAARISPALATRDGLRAKTDRSDTANSRTSQRSVASRHRSA